VGAGPGAAGAAGAAMPERPALGVLAAAVGGDWTAARSSVAVNSASAASRPS